MSEIHLGLLLNAQLMCNGAIAQRLGGSLLPLLVPEHMASFAPLWLLDQANNPPHYQMAKELVDAVLSAERWSTETATDILTRWKQNAELPVHTISRFVLSVALFVIAPRSAEVQRNVSST